MGDRPLLFVAGTQLRAPVHFWRQSSPHFVPGVQALMVSFAEVIRRGAVLADASRRPVRELLGFHGQVFLDNGSFAPPQGCQRVQTRQYIRYVEGARPDWYPVPRDFIPLPSSTQTECRNLARKTARMNQRYSPRGFVPVLHVGPAFKERLRALLARYYPAYLAIGGVVPHIRASKGADIQGVLEAIAWARRQFEGAIHVFGLGGSPASLHVAAALGVDSVDSSGWRTRAARGLILVPGFGERMALKAGTRRPGTIQRTEREVLEACECGVCCAQGLGGLTDGRRAGFANRACHNLWVLQRETDLLNAQRLDGLTKSWALDRFAYHGRRYLIAAAYDSARRIAA